MLYLLHMCIIIRLLCLLQGCAVPAVQVVLQSAGDLWAQLSHGPSSSGCSALMGPLSQVTVCLQAPPWAAWLTLVL